MRSIRKHSFIFIIETGTYPDEIIISIGGSRTELLAFCKKSNVKKPVVDFLSDDKNEPAHTDGFVRNYTDGKSIFLWMRPYDGGWRWFETLIHELHHVVHFNLQKCKSMENEVEALAYQQ